MAASSFSLNLQQYTDSTRSFRFLIEHLDADTFQPWVAYYPSGASLSLCAEYLSQMMDKLRLRYGVKRLFVVAHSMGGPRRAGFSLALPGGRAA